MGLPRTTLRLSASSGTTKIYDRPGGTAHWIDGEIGENVFRDARLGKRFRELLIRMGGGIGESIPLACQDWANTKAAYRFFANKRVHEGDILSGHFDATRARFEAARGTVLLLQETRRSLPISVLAPNLSESRRTSTAARTRKAATAITRFAGS
ncbi:hypothetical protein ABIC03_007581 [Bradyrhizobium sp. RT6a]|uniref:IS4/Tn5 family transposase DNA-binding protein n=1 Tax=Bradyrhizobium sp. RT6a TaxID=3156381 RepID=UPI0033986787